jgi:hypothetical protein
VKGFFKKSENGGQVLRAFKFGRMITSGELEP